MRNLILAAIAAISFTACHKSTPTSPTYSITGHRWYQQGDTSLYLTFSADSIYLHHPALVPNPNATNYTRQGNTLTIIVAAITTTCTITADTLTWSSSTKTAHFYRKY